MYEAQISFVICGPKDWQWVAYAFVDAHFDGNDLEDEEFSYEGFQVDPIASGELDANLPIMNPRLSPPRLIPRSLIWLRAVP